MKRITPLVTLALAGALLSSRGVGAQDRFATVQIEVIPITESLFMLVGAGGNIGLSVGEDGAFIVDDQFAPLTERIKAAIATVTEDRVHFVLNTHWHGDHTGGNENFGGEGAMIVAHDNVYRRLNPAEFEDVVGRSQQAPEAALPVLTFSETMTFHWNDEDIWVTHPEHAHTDGDAVVYFMEQNVVHMGDTFFNGFYPFIDLDSGGGVDGLIENADDVLARVDSSTRIIPGHGPLSDAAGLTAYRDMLVTVRDRVRRMINDGMDVEAIVEAAPTHDLDDIWASRGDEWTGRFVRSVHRSLMR